MSDRPDQDSSTSRPTMLVEPIPPMSVKSSGKYLRLMKAAAGDFPDAPNEERLEWLRAKQAREHDPKAYRTPGQPPWYPPQLKPPKIAEVLGIDVERVETVCDHAKLRQYMNDARCELQVRELRSKWDSGEACDVVDLTEAATMLRMSTPKARQLLADHAIRPLNASRKPYLYPRADVLALVGVGHVSTPRSVHMASDRELRTQREAEISSVRADFDRQDAEIHAEITELQSKIKILSDNRARLRTAREVRVAEIRVDYEVRIREAGG